MIAVVLVILLENGLLLARTNPFYVQFFLGALILLAVMFNQWRARRVVMGLTNRRVVSP